MKKMTYEDKAEVAHVFRTLYMDPSACVTVENMIDLINLVLDHRKKKGED